ncbi:MAG: amidohydrolase [Bacteroidia bacterium]|nr:amidohydrolase [Bacteroidia bacterium]
MLVGQNSLQAGGTPEKISRNLRELAASSVPTVIELRRYFHQNPELSNREFKTAAKVAEFLTSLGLEVKTGVAHTGVIATLKGGKPGKTVALRADMDALPVPERTGLPFASTAKGNLNGQEVSVMHACGHDAHTAILLGVARVLSSLKAELPGTVVFLFQPSEEGAPEGEEGGASLMVKEGALKGVDAIFGLHVKKEMNVGQIGYRPEGFMAAADRFVIRVKGKQTHGSTPWTGVDPIVVSAQIVQGLQNIISRQTNLTEAAAVITVGSIHGGLRFNIIPEEVEMVGTVRTLDSKMQDEIHRRMVQTTHSIAESAGAEAEIDIQRMCPVTYNDIELTRKMLPSLQTAAGAENVFSTKPIMGAEDFAFYQKEVPGLYFFVGITPKGADAELAPPHHTPEFFIDESGLELGVRALSQCAVDYLFMKD